MNEKAEHRMMANNVITAVKNADVGHVLNKPETEYHLMYGFIRIVRLSNDISHFNRMNNHESFLNLDSWNEAFEVITCVLDIPKCSCRVYTWVTNDNHNISIDGKLIYVGRESRILDLHSLKLRLGFATT